MTLVAPRPLEGILVLDFTRETAGPFATMLMADMGALVIKVEEPESGDPSRTHGPTCQGESAWFLALNRNKRSLAVDITVPQGVALMRQLAAKADVVVEDYSPGIMDSLGLGYAALKAENPRLVYVSVTGFGQDGPEADAPACDLLLQAMGGAMSLSGPPSGEPCCSGLPQADLTTGLLAMQGTLLALLSRHRTDKGQHVDVAGLDGQVALLSTVATAFLGTGQAPARHGNAHPSLAPFELFPASDAPLALAVGTNEQFDALCEAIGLPELAADERFATAEARVQARAELNEALAPALQAHTAEHWVSVLRDEGVPAAPLLDVPELLAHPQVAARGMIAEVEHPVAGRVRVPGPPVKLSATPARVDMAPPLLGEHSVEVLRVVLDMKDADIDDMLGGQVVRQQAQCPPAAPAAPAECAESAETPQSSLVEPPAAPEETPLAAPVAAEDRPVPPPVAQATPTDQGLETVLPSLARSSPRVAAAPSALVSEPSLPPAPTAEPSTPGPIKPRFLDPAEEPATPPVETAATEETPVPAAVDAGVQPPF